MMLSILISVYLHAMDDESSYLNFNILTWNVGGNFVGVHIIESLFLPQESVGLTELCNDTDVLVIGLQEAYPNVQDALTSSLPIIGRDPLVESFSQVLANNGFSRLSYCRILGILILVFVKRPLLCYIREVDTCSFRTGFGGLLGNKGATSIRFLLGDISLVFTNCHLVPHEENNDRRSQELHDIIMYQTFSANGLSSMKLLDHDVVVLFGDLNYRLEGKSFDEISEHIVLNDRKWLFKRDQLRLEQVKGHISPSFLHRFMEMQLDFNPSYKFEPGTDIYNDGGKGRAPAWCDRILWTIHDRKYPKITDNEPRAAVKPISYNIHMQPKLSDHKAVSARLQIHSNLDTSPHVIFRLSEWICNEQGCIEFDIKSGTVISIWDWIGLYQADFVTAEKDYEFWIYTPAMRGVASSMTYYKRSLNPDQVPNTPGCYVLLYNSVQYKCVLGMSPIFRIASSLNLN